MTFKLTPKTISFLLVVGILAMYLFELDTQETLERSSFQGFQVVDGNCMYYDGFNYCQVAKAQCLIKGNIHLGFCEDIIGVTRAAGEACGGDDANNSFTCDDGEFCDSVLEICVDPEHVPSWSTYNVDNGTSVESEFRADWDSWTEDIEIQKKWLWYTLFFGGTLVSLGLIFPIKRRQL